MKKDPYVLEKQLLDKILEILRECLLANYMVHSESKMIFMCN